MNVKYLTILAISSTLLLTGCGNDTATATGDPTPDPALKTSSPMLTGVVSASSNTTLTVDNVIFDTSNTTFISDGTTDFSPGLVVTVEGIHAGLNGIADKIRYDSEVEGVVISSSINAIPISALTDATTFLADSVTYEGTMNVMGQSIIIDAMTMFKNVADPTTIVMDNVVEISGMFEEDGTIRAKRIEYKADSLLADDEVEVKGYVKAYDETTNSFMLGECEIQITPDTLLDGIDLLEDGMKVEVESIGDLVQTDPMCSILALKIENKDRAGYHKMTILKGMVVGEVLDGMFMLQNADNAPIKVMIEDNTHFVNGTAVDIVDGTMLKAIGKYDVNDVLVAKLIKFPGMDVKIAMIEGIVTTDLMDGMFKLENLDGVAETIIVNADTQFLPFGASAADIKIDTKLKAIGIYNDMNELVANLIKLKSMEVILDKVKGMVVSEPDMDGMFTVEDKDGNMVTVVLNAETKYLPMSATEADIKIDVMLMAVGIFDGNNNLVAAMVTIRNMGEIPPMPPGITPIVNLNGSVETVVLTDLANPELGGEITVLGQTILVSAETRIFKEVSMPVQNPPGGMGRATTMAKHPAMMFTLADVNPGDYVMIMASSDEKDVLTARFIEVKPASDDMPKSKIFGPVTAADPATNTLIVGGVTVVVTEMTEIYPADTYDMVKIAEAIKAGTKIDAMVKGSYDMTTGALTATRIAVHELNIVM